MLGLCSRMHKIRLNKMPMPTTQLFIQMKNEFYLTRLHKKPLETAVEMYRHSNRPALPIYKETDKRDTENKHESSVNNKA